MVRFLKSVAAFKAHLSFFIPCRLNETFLVFYKEKTNELIEEHIVSFDNDENLLVEIDLLTGRNVARYNIGNDLIFLF